MVKVRNLNELLIAPLSDVNFCSEKWCYSVEGGYRKTHEGNVLGNHIRTSYESLSNDILYSYRYLGLSNGEFYNYDTLYVPPFRTYLSFSYSYGSQPNAKPAPMRISFDGQVTGLATIEADHLNLGPVDVYDIFGRKVKEQVSSYSCLEDLSDGIYIVNGTKCIVKKGKVIFVL